MKIEDTQTCSVLKFMKWKSYTKSQLNVTKHVGEKCGKLCMSSILSSKMEITPTKIDENWQHSNLICRTLKHVGEKCGS